jgi:hypothetical protein
LNCKNAANKRRYLTFVDLIIEKSMKIKYGNEENDRNFSRKSPTDS